MSSSTSRQAVDVGDGVVWLFTPPAVSEAMEDEGAIPGMQALVALRRRLLDGPRREGPLPMEFLGLSENRVRRMQERYGDLRARADRIHTERLVDRWPDMLGPESARIDLEADADGATLTTSYLSGLWSLYASAPRWGFGTATTEPLDFDPRLLQLAGAGEWHSPALEALEGDAYSRGLVAQRTAFVWGGERDRGYLPVENGDSVRRSLDWWGLGSASSLVGDLEAAHGLVGATHQLLLLLPTVVVAGDPVAADLVAATRRQLTETVRIVKAITEQRREVLPAPGIHEMAMRGIGSARRALGMSGGRGRKTTRGRGRKTTRGRVARGRNMLKKTRHPRRAAKRLRRGGVSRGKRRMETEAEPTRKRQRNDIRSRTQPSDCTAVLAALTQATQGLGAQWVAYRDAHSAAAAAAGRADASHYDAGLVPMPLEAKAVGAVELRDDPPHWWSPRLQSVGRQINMRASSSPDHGAMMALVSETYDLLKMVPTDYSRHLAAAVLPVPTALIERTVEQVSKNLEVLGDCVDAIGAPQWLLPGLQRAWWEVGGLVDYLVAVGQRRAEGAEEENAFGQ